MAAPFESKSYEKIGEFTGWVIKPSIPHFAFDTQILASFFLFELLHPEIDLGVGGFVAIVALARLDCPSFRRMRKQAVCKFLRRKQSRALGPGDVSHLVI